MTEPLDEATARAWRLHDPRLPPAPDRTKVARRLRRGSLSRALAQRAARGGHRTVVGVDGEQVDLQTMHRQVQALAAHLAARGVQAGRPTMLVAPNSLDFIRCYLALLALRSPVLLANPTATATELRNQMARAHIGVVLSGGQAGDVVADVLANIRSGGAAADPPSGADATDPGKPRSGWPESAGVVHLSVEAKPAAELAGPKSAQLPHAGDVAICAFTSGTTGEPKMAPLRHGDVQASIRGVMAAWRWRRADVVVHALPMFHQHGLGALHAALLSGSSLHCLSRFDPQRIIDEAKARRASVIMAVPAMWERIVGTHSRIEAEALRLAISGSAPLPATLFERIHEVLGMAPLERYGTTESGLNLSNLYDGPRLPGGVGYPVPGTEIAVDSATGELSVRGPQIFAGYAGRGPLRRGDWFATGDLAELDPQSGAVTITGRSKDLIITGGMNVHPREVEEAVAAHPDVAAAAVVGAPSARWGEEVTAFVVSYDGFDEDDLRRRARRTLSAYKVPKRFHRIDDLPRNHMGKIMRSELVRLAVDLGAGRASGDETS